MGKNPAFQFYPKDWKSDLELQSCSLAARGLMIELMAIMHLSEKYGFLVQKGDKIVAKKLRKLVNSQPEEFRKAFKELTEKVLKVDEKTGAYYSKRMVEDEKLRQVRREGGKLGGNPELIHKVNLPSKQEVNHKGYPQGYPRVPPPPSPSSSPEESLRDSSGDDSSFLHVATGRAGQDRAGSSPARDLDGPQEAPPDHLSEIAHGWSFDSELPGQNSEKPQDKSPPRIPGDLPPNPTEEEIRDYQTKLTACHTAQVLLFHEYSDKMREADKLLRDLNESDGLDEALGQAKGKSP